MRSQTAMWGIYARGERFIYTLLFRIALEHSKWHVHSVNL